MRLRRIRLKILAAQGAVYRLSAICCDTLFVWILTGDLKIAAGASLGYNALKMGVYYLFHYLWARVFKLGRE